METNPILQSPETIVTLAWIGLATAGVMAVPFTVIGAIAYWKSENPAGSFSRLFERAQALKLTTVILIILSVTVLAFFKIIDSNGAVGILSGIAGYVLGGLETRQSNVNTSG
jgi:hypothetical protein